MGAFARETRLSETTFVQTSHARRAPTTATASGRSPARCRSPGTRRSAPRSRSREARGEREASYVQQTGAGLQPIDVRRDGDGVDGVDAPGAGDVRRGGGAASRDGRGRACYRRMRTANCTPQIVSTGLADADRAGAPGGCDRERRARLRPGRDAARRAAGAVNLYLVWYDGERARAGADVHPLRAGGEDPATGSAAGPLCAYLHARGIASRVEISQGVEMGRPSRLRGRDRRRPRARQRRGRGR